MLEIGYETAGDGKAVLTAQRLDGVYGLAGVTLGHDPHLLFVHAGGESGGKCFGQNEQVCLRVYLLGY